MQAIMTAVNLKTLNLINHSLTKQLIGHIVLHYQKLVERGINCNQML